MKNEGASGSALFGADFPAWSPSGDTIIGTISNGLVKNNFNLSEIVDTLFVRVDHPEYSSEGTRIVGYWNFNLWLVNTADGKTLQLTDQGVDGAFGLPFGWSPDRSEIIYTIYRSND